MDGILEGLPLMVRPDRVGGEVFSTMFELHAGVLGLACGVLVVLFFVYGWENVGLVLLLLFSLTAMGYLPYEGTGRGLTFVRLEPWYFLSALATIPVLYTFRSLATGETIERPGETTAVEAAPADD